MCGIVGVISVTGHVNAQDKRAFMQQGLYVGALRGRDGTGLFTVGSKSGRSWVRMPATGSRFLQEPLAKSAIGDMHEHFAMIGHNRSATIGSVSMDNTHPFCEGPITLVHNGTLESHRKLPKAESAKDVDVDSHAITHALAVASVDAVIGDLEGAFVLCWHDSRDGSVNIIRNNKRPLHLAIAQGGRTVYMASELDMLKWLASRNNIILTDYIQPLPGTLLSWDSSAHHIKPVMRKVGLYVSKYSSYGQNVYSGGWHGRGGNVYDDDDAYDWYKPAESATAPASSAVVALPHLPSVGDDNKVLVRASDTGNTNDIQKERAVPEAMQLALEDAYLTINDRMMFTPFTVIREGRATNRIACLWGVVGGGMVGARVYNLDARVVDLPLPTAEEQRFEVAPIGIDNSDPGNVELICRVIRKIKDSEEFEYRYEYQEEAENLYEGIEPTITDEEEDDTDVAGPRAASYIDEADCEDADVMEGVHTSINSLLTYPGPFGSTISKGRFMEITQEGCGACGEPLETGDDAWNCSWIILNGRSVAICGSCTKEEKAWDEHKATTSSAWAARAAKAAAGL